MKQYGLISGWILLSNPTMKANMVKGLGLIANKCISVYASISLNYLWYFIFIYINPISAFQIFDLYSVVGCDQHKYILRVAYTQSQWLDTKKCAFSACKASQERKCRTIVGSDNATKNESITLEYLLRLRLQSFTYIDTELVSYNMFLVFQHGVLVLSQNMKIKAE